MVEEHGTIIESKNGLVLISTVLQDGCESCSSRPLCHGEEGSDVKKIEAYNPIDAQVGDKVLFQVPTKVMLKAGATTYLFPLIALVIGIFFGQALGEEFFPNSDKEIIGFTMGVAFLLLAFGVTKINSNKQGYGKEFRPTVVKILA